MSDRELMRATVLDRMIRGELTSLEGADLLALSIRQVKRLRKRFALAGAKGIAHGNVARRSNRARALDERERVLKLIRERYSGPPERGWGQRLGPTLVGEHLLEDEGIDVPISTLRRWMKDDGLWARKRKWHHRFRRRERRAHFGELVQLDGSFHEWLEDRGPGGCLMTMSDDATSTELALMGEQETLWSAAALLEWWVEKYGVPRALYTDMKTLYHSPGRACDRDDRPLTQFGLMCSKLGIELIRASSPQAKGRVERAHGTNQDRLVKKLRLKGISSHEEMNRYLRESYLPAHNARFAKPAREEADYHLPLKTVMRGRRRGDIWCQESERRLSNDGVISYGNRKLQVRERRDMPKQSKVRVRETKDGKLKLVYKSPVPGNTREHDLEWKEFTGQPKIPVLQKQAEKQVAGITRPSGGSTQPGPTHRWRLLNNADIHEALQARREREMQTTPQVP